MPDKRSGRSTIPLRTQAAAALAICLGACSPEPADAPIAGPAAENVTMRAPPAAKASERAPLPAPEPTLATAKVLTLDGLGALKIGQPVPAGTTWSARGAQIPGSCRTISSPDFPGVYAIVEGGAVRRITIGGNSSVKLTEGFGIGASEAKVRAAFPGFRQEPHKYVESPAKYLTVPNAARGDPALRFEIGQKGKVSLMHIGTIPVLGYVEGCA